MELRGLEETAVSEQTGFCGLFAARSTSGPRAGAEGSAPGQCRVWLGTVASNRQGITRPLESFSGRHGGSEK